MQLSPRASRLGSVRRAARGSRADADAVGGRGRLGTRTGRRGCRRRRLRLPRRASGDLAAGCRGVRGVVAPRPQRQAAALCAMRQSRVLDRRPPDTRLEIYRDPVDDGCRTIQSLGRARRSRRSLGPLRRSPWPTRCRDHRSIQASSAPSAPPVPSAEHVEHHARVHHMSPALRHRRRDRPRREHRRDDL